MHRTVLALCLVVLIGASCANAPGKSSQSLGSVSTGISRTSVPSSTRPSSALDDLTAYFAAAAGIDQNLKAAAAVANGAIGRTQITITQGTLEAIAAADPTPVAGDIPAGLPSEVLLRVLTVQSDLVSR